MVSPGFSSDLYASSSAPEQPLATTTSSDVNGDAAVEYSLAIALRVSGIPAECTYPFAESAVALLATAATSLSCGRFPNLQDRRGQGRWWACP